MIHSGDILVVAQIRIRGEQCCNPFRNRCRRHNGDASIHKSGSLFRCETAIDELALRCEIVDEQMIIDLRSAGTADGFRDEERRAVGREMEILSDYGPFKDLNLE